MNTRYCIQRSMASTIASVSCLQLAPRAGEGRHARIDRVVAAVAAGPPADLVVLPELWDVGYFSFDEYRLVACPLPQTAVSELADVARRRQIVLVAGSVIERDGDRLPNTVPVIGPDGALLGSYRKRHLFGYRSREAEILTPGSSDGIVDTPIGRLGLATCFDLRFPEHFTELRQAAADLIVVPAAWPAARAGHWMILTQARAIETQTPLVAVNGAGDTGGVGLAGRSLIVDARGPVLAAAGLDDGELWLTAAVDHDDTASWRREFPLREATTVG